MRSVLEHNLAAIRLRQAGVAEAVAQADPAALDWAEARTGLATASIDHAGRALALGSRYDPAREAERLIEGVEPDKTACAVVIGLALGYHARALAQRLGPRSLLVVYEPDARLARAVLERVDHADWLARPGVELIVGPIDRAGLIGRLERHSGTITQGTQIVTHPVTRKLAAEAVRAFGQAVTEAIAFYRTNVATALVNAARTCRNLVCNLPYYGAGDTVEPLRGAAAGAVAVCVGAGPSLAKNVDLLTDPAVRERVVVIAAQTTLRPLLDRGVHPDFVTALDYSAICRQFYEDLPPLPDVTLVVEPKANPAILDTFPGPIRVTRSPLNDRVLGELARPITPMGSGATVAHLSFYLAQFLGCDPIVLIGQDLGFSDGLYYAPGTAVHRVWAGELGRFNTLEMMEWQRVARMKGHLERHTDVHGRPIFSDEQMLTYLKQFERDFAAAPQRVIDATQGGMPKADAEAMPLAEALERFAAGERVELPRARAGLDADRLGRVRRCLAERLEQVLELRRVCQKTVPLLEEMLKHLDDKARVKRVFDKVEKQRARVQGDLADAFDLINQLNTIGAFKRARADRAIGQLSGDAAERQRQQLGRDLENMRWIIQACDEASDIFREAEARAARIASDPAAVAPPPPEVPPEGSAEAAAEVSPGAPGAHAAA